MFFFSPYLQISSQLHKLSIFLFPFLSSLVYPTSGLRLHSDNILLIFSMSLSFTSRSSSLSHSYFIFLPCLSLIPCCIAYQYFISTEPQISSSISVLRLFSTTSLPVPLHAFSVLLSCTNNFHSSDILFYQQRSIWCSSVFRLYVSLFSVSMFLCFPSLCPSVFSSCISSSFVSTSFPVSYHIFLIHVILHLAIYLAS